MTRRTSVSVLQTLLSFADFPGNAKIEGLLPSLGMTGEQYNIALAIFFIPYVLAEVPSNMILNHFGKPSVYLGTLIFTWGIIMMCTGFVQSFGSLVAIRFLLGLFEYTFLPPLSSRC